MKTLHTVMALAMGLAIISAKDSYGDRGMVDNLSTTNVCLKNIGEVAPCDVALEFVRSKDYEGGSKLVLRVVAIDSGYNAGFKKAVLRRDGVPIETWENVKHIMTTRIFYEFVSVEHTYAFDAVDYGGHIVHPPPITHHFRPEKLPL